MMSEKVTTGEKLKKHVLRELNYLHASNIISAFGGHCITPVRSGDSTVHIPTLETQFATLDIGFETYLATTVDTEALALKPNSFTLFVMPDDGPVVPLATIEKVAGRTTLKTGGQLIKKRSELTTVLTLLESMYPKLAVQQVPLPPNISPA